MLKVIFRVIAFFWAMYINAHLFYETIKSKWRLKKRERLKKRKREEGGLDERKFQRKS